MKNTPLSSFLVFLISLFLTGIKVTAQHNDLAGAISVDSHGNVYVTGRSEGEGTMMDYMTLKYNSSGELKWTKRYNGPANQDDIPSGIALDLNGNVYVTGTSRSNESMDDYTTIKYDSSGNELWIVRYDYQMNGDLAMALTTDDLGNVYVTGKSSSDYATVKYNTSGVQQWVSRYDGGEEDFATDISVDQNGNVYITGSSYATVSNYDYATIKYNSSGTQLWAVRCNGTGNYSDMATSIAVDNSGNVFVTGNSFDNPGGYEDYLTVKYDAGGNQLWTNRYNGPSNRTDLAADLAVDNSGNVYVTGSSRGSGTFLDYATIKYDASGNQLWVARYNGTGAYSDEAFSLFVKGTDVYVTGYSNGTNGRDVYATIKYNEYGNQMWASEYAGQGFDNYAMKICVDISGNVFVTGYSYSEVTQNDYATIKYDNSGNEIWSKIFDGTLPVTFPLSVTIADGWNMVSIPGINPDGQGIENWWSGHIGTVYEFVPGSGYSAVTVTQPGKGYWMKNSGDNVYNTGDEWPASGIQIVVHNPVNASTGWNMFGGYETEISADALTTDPPGQIIYPIYKFVPGTGYQTANQIEPGYAYWIKVLSNCEINVSN